MIGTRHSLFLRNPTRSHQPQVARPFLADTITTLHFGTPERQEDVLARLQTAEIHPEAPLSTLESLGYFRTPQRLYYHRFLPFNDVGLSIVTGMATGKPPITLCLSPLIAGISDVKEHLGDIGGQLSAL